MKLSDRLKQFVKRGIWKFKNIIERVGGQKKYTKFIIVTKSRTGSSLLTSYLDSHPEVRCFEEIFRRLGSSTTKQAWENIYGKRNKRVKAVGFKIFYYHPLDSDDRSVWDLIYKNADLKVIHLIRENSLRTIVSREIAVKTNKWNNKGDGTMDQSKKKIHLDPKDLMKQLDEIRVYQNEFRKKMSNKEMKEISYEELVANRDSTMSTLFEFIGVAPNPVSTFLKKQNKEELKDLIVNYDEVSQTLKNSDYYDQLAD